MIVFPVLLALGLIWAFLWWKGTNGRLQVAVLLPIIFAVIFFLVLRTPLF